MSLTELAQKSGVQIATLSRMENQKMTGTLQSHIQIAQALGVDLTELYQNVAKELPKSDEESAPEEPSADVFNYSDRSSYEILTNKVLAKKMMPVLLKIEAGGCTNKEELAAGCEKFVFVLEGQIRADVEDKAYRLGPGNTLYFNASLPHTFVNEGPATARLICVTTPVGL